MQNPQNTSGFNADTMGLHMGAGPQIPSLNRLRGYVRPTLQNLDSTTTVNSTTTIDSTTALVGHHSDVSTTDLGLLSDTQTIEQQMAASAALAEKARFKKLQAYLAKKKARQQANDANIVARLENRRLLNRDSKMTFLHDVENHPLAGFPKTPREVSDLSEEELDNLLASLKLVALRPEAIEIGGTKESKRVRFVVMIGLSPNIGSYIPAWQSGLEI